VTGTNSSPCSSAVRKGTAAFTSVLLLAAVRTAFAGHHHHAPPPPTPPCPPPSVLAAGPEHADLKIHIVGDYGDTIEVFFRDDLYRETFPVGSYLQYGRVILGPSSTHGTFAVCYGPSCDTLKVYGYRTAGTEPVVYGPVQLMPGWPVDPQWVTPTILKVRFGPQLSHELILKFTGSASGWRVLYDSRTSAPAR
jgi:hypothetical protein